MRERETERQRDRDRERERERERVTLCSVNRVCTAQSTGLRGGARPAQSEPLAGSD